VLFEAILSDLFPGQELSSQDLQAVPVAVRAVCADLGLQPVASFVDKVLQLNATVEVRFGVMLIGPAGRTVLFVCLTSCWLCHGLCKHAEQLIPVDCVCTALARISSAGPDHRNQACQGHHASITVRSCLLHLHRSNVHAGATSAGSRWCMTDVTLCIS
jgi:hypothetical protein